MSKDRESPVDVVATDAIVSTHLMYNAFTETWDIDLVLTNRSVSHLSSFDDQGEAETALLHATNGLATARTPYVKVNETSFLSINHIVRLSMDEVTDGSWTTNVEDVTGQEHRFAEGDYAHCREQLENLSQVLGRLNSEAEEARYGRRQRPKRGVDGSTPNKNL